MHVNLGKLLSRATKVAYLLLHKLMVGSGKDAVPLVRPGDRVALVYPNNDPLNFMVAFYGCVLSGVIPVPIEVPITKRVRVFFVFIMENAN